MPYVKQPKRDNLQPVIDAFARCDANNLGEGDMDYLITRLLTQWIQSKGICYAVLNAAVGILECSKLELSRRILGPYEKIKVVENGDIPIYEQFPNE